MGLDCYLSGPSKPEDAYTAVSKMVSRARNGKQAFREQSGEFSVLEV